MLNVPASHHGITMYSNTKHVKRSILKRSPSLAQGNPLIEITGDVTAQFTEKPY